MVNINITKKPLNRVENGNCKTKFLIVICKPLNKINKAVASEINKLREKNSNLPLR